MACLLFIFLARMVLFGNPVLWDFYVRNLLPEDVGWRERSILIYERDGRRNPFQQWD